MNTTAARPITPKEIQAVRDSLPAALKLICEAYGLEMKPGKATYDALHFTMKIEFTREGQAAARLSKEFDGILDAQYGLKVGAIVKGGTGVAWRITGTTRSEKWPLSAVKLEDGKPYRIGVRGLKHEDGTPVVDKFWIRPALGLKP